jgi:class 3 adenylate cyclase
MDAPRSLVYILVDTAVEALVVWTYIMLSAVALVAGVAGGLMYARRSETRAHPDAAPIEKRLEEYDFYPFLVNSVGHVEFSPEHFSLAVDHLLKERNTRAAGELIVIGEQNLVRETLPTPQLNAYRELFRDYDGASIVVDNDLYLENYKRLVNQIGRSFPNTGIEVLLHNLVNPARSLVAIEGGEVTGRSIGSGATNLVLDLKTRKQRGQDKVNYELNIGSRKFKCTTVGIFRPDFGLVGALCINIDVNFIRDAASDGGDRLNAFVDNLLRTDFELDENILSRDEYASAQRGKRHYLDEAIRATGSGADERSLAAIFFSDIVGFTTLMGADETMTLDIIRANDELHQTAIVRHGGVLLKKLGDGILASFPSASGAVECARDVRRAVASDGRYAVRVGIHLGEVVRRHGDVHGDGVNIASRIQAVIDPGQIGVSQVVYDNVRNKEGIAVTLVGPVELKNVDHPVVLYTVDPADDEGVAKD